MKKIIFLSIVLFMLSGCTIKYDLDLTTPNAAIENLDILETDLNNEYFSTIKNYTGNIRTIYSDQDSDSYEKDPNLDYYNITNNSDDNKANLIISYPFTTEEFADSNIINTCYENVTFYNTNDKIDIRTSNEFLCFEKYISAQEVEVNIKTNQKILNNNADYIENNVYTWKINKSNAYQKPIILSNIENSTQEQIKEENNQLNLIIILSVIGAFVVAIIIVIINKNHKYK